MVFTKTQSPIFAGSIGVAEAELVYHAASTADGQASCEPEVGIPDSCLDYYTDTLIIEKSHRGRRQANTQCCKNAPRYKIWSSSGIGR